MIESRKTYRRAATSLGIFIVICIIVLGLASTLAYFNMGADQQEVLLITDIQKNVHTPKISWLPDDLKHPKELNEYQRKDIVDSYIMAWYKLNEYFENGNKEALRDHFSEEYLRNLNHDHGLLDIRQIDLSHQLQLKHFSLDNQFVAFTDYDVDLIKSVKSATTEEVVFQSNHQLDYSVVMTLDEGRWRIRQMKMISLDSPVGKSAVVNRSPKVNYFRGVNYYPAKSPWFDFWENYDPVITKEDLKLIKSLKLQVVRIFIPFEYFGKGNIDRVQLAKLKDFLDQCENFKIKVVPTLFDFPIGFELEKYSLYDRHLEILLSTFANHKSIAYWCLKNESDLDFKYHGKQKTLEWLNFIIEKARVYAPESRFTIGWSHPKYGDLLADQLDLVSFHFYEQSNELKKEIQDLKEKIGSKSMVLEEFGIPSRAPFGLLDNTKNQKEYFSEIVKICNQESVPWLAWTLHDFEHAPSEVFGWKPWVKAKQKYFGLVDSSGKLKFEL